MTDHVGPGAAKPNLGFLGAAAAGATSVCLLAAAWGLAGSLAPSADTVANPAWIDVRLSEIPEGSEQRITYLGQPLIIRHRTAEEIASAESALPGDYRDNQSYDLFGEAVGTADDRTRRATEDGRFIAVLGTVNRGCLVLSYEGDWGGWFGPCLGDHFDTSGRIRRGVDQNLRLPRVEWIPPDTLRLILTPTYIASDRRDALLAR